MLIEIKHRFDGRVLFAGEYLSLCDAMVAAAKSRADLSRADLSGANLSRADLSRADLSGANLSGADLSGADLSRADLSDALGCPTQACTPLLMLLDQPGKIRAYKLVNAKGEGPINGGLKYEIGKRVEVADANTNPNTHCAEGINVATLDWCLREWKEGFKILLVEFEAADIAAIPTATDGKFRLHRCDVVGEKDVTEILAQMRPALEAKS